MFFEASVPFSSKYHSPSQYGHIVIYTTNVFYIYVCTCVFIKVGEFIYAYKSQVSSVGIETWLRTGQPRNCA